METFKAVEKEMKTKAFSKEGLSQNIKQDPKEKERSDLCDFLSDQTDEINRILTEELEPEIHTLQTALKRKQKDSSKADRMAELEGYMETYKWHESRLQLLLRSLQNGNVENDVVAAIKSDIEEVVRDAREPEFDPDGYEGIYDDCNLDSEEAQFGLANEGDRISSQDAQSIQEDNEPEPATLKKTKSEPMARRPSTQLKSPLPALATLNTMPPPVSIPKDPGMKPAPLPNRPPGETLKYASAAAAAAASDKSGMGINPLPAPVASSPTSSMPPLPAPIKSSATTSPASIPAQPAEKTPSPVTAPPSESAPQEQSSHSKSPTLSSTSAPGASVPSSIPPTPAMEIAEAVQEPVIADEIATTNGDTHENSAEESIYHLPPGLQDLLDSFETTKNRVSQPSSQLSRVLQASQDMMPEALDADRPQHYRPTVKYNTPAHYPQDVLPIFDDPALYDNQRMETDTLFYIFYYRQNTYQQWLAARALKNQSWRFHKQYQTWFQRHEEPKQITEEFEQGTYRFFDYESTWYVTNNFEILRHFGD